MGVQRPQLETYNLGYSDEFNYHIVPAFSIFQYGDIYSSAIAIKSGILLEKRVQPYYTFYDSYKTHKKLIEGRKYFLKLL